MDELLELARRGRVLFVAPLSLDRYEPAFVNKLVEQAPDCVLFSRRLGAASVLESRRRLPFVYPPLGAIDRHALSAAMAQAAREMENPEAARIIRAILPVLQTNWTSGETLVHKAGALATSWGALGSLMSALYLAARGEDRLIELTGAAGPVEWAGSLGASVFAPPIGGRSAELATELCASLFSGARRGAAPATLGDVSPVLKGLLTLDNDAPVLDVEKAFGGGDIDRLHALIARIVREHLDPDFLDAEIKDFNRRVEAFESKQDRLQRLSYVGLAASLSIPAAAIELTHAISPTAAGAVTLGAWLLNGVLVTMKPKGGRGSALIDAARAANAWTSGDVVLVSRLRKRLERD